MSNFEGNNIITGTYDNRQNLVYKMLENYNEYVYAFNDKPFGG